MNGIEISYAAAAGAGLLSFLSPCVLPLVPAYLCFIAGTSLEQLTADGVPADLGRRVFFAALAFVLGFASVFIVMGASASAINQLVFSHIDVISKVAGVVIFIFGLHFTGLVKIPLLYREVRFNPEEKPAGLFGAYAIGLAFAFGWTPCIGPVLATILTIAASRDDLGFGVSLLSTYAAGLGLPFLLAALGMKPFMRFMFRFRRHVHKVEIVAGVLMMGTGLLIFTGALNTLGFYLLEAFPFLASIG